MNKRYSQHGDGSPTTYVVKVLVGYVRHFIGFVDIAVSQKELTVLRNLLAFVFYAVGCSFWLNA